MMHIPDGFVDARTAVTMGALSIAGVGIALRQARLTLPPQRVPLLGLAAAFIFAAQMLNFPVAGGTSGHLIGAVLAAVLLGPYAGILVITAVLIVQCLLFADGGVTALGANIFNMALIGCIGGWMVYRPIRKRCDNLFGAVLASMFAAWCATVAASIACAAELAASRVVDWSVALPAMAGVHMIIGAGEGLITGLIVAAIGKTRPDLLGLTPSDDTPAPLGALIGIGLVISIGLALFVAPFASPWPAGLEKVAQTLHFDHVAWEQPALTAPLPEYEAPGVTSPAIATSLAGLVGTIVMFALAWVTARMVTRQTP
jgi:cobalt/nickel transport system permease protein